MREGDDLAARLAAFHDKSYGWALACCARRAEEATDVLQDAYTKVLSGAARYEGRSSLKTWFFGVIRLTAREHLRRALVRRWFARSPPDPQPMEAPRATDELAADRQVARAVSEALSELSERQREVLHLVFYEDLSIAEAAEIMRVSLGTARLHYDRGKTRLREIFETRGMRFHDER